jgi:hypothetical protein
MANNIKNKRKTNNQMKKTKTTTKRISWKSIEKEIEEKQIDFRSFVPLTKKEITVFLNKYYSRGGAFCYCSVNEKLVHSFIVKQIRTIFDLSFMPAGQYSSLAKLASKHRDSVVQYIEGVSRSFGFLDKTELDNALIQNLTKPTRTIVNQSKSI